ncbi:MAG: hypothetical protein ACLFTT_06730 [Candidatus Hydrogenedentota bacterium]
MGTGPKIALAALAVIVVGALGLPILVGLSQGWNEQTLVGTQWRADNEGLEFLITFKEDGALQIDIPELPARLDEELAKVPPDQAQALRPIYDNLKQRLRSGNIIGSWRVTEDTIYVKPPAGTPGSEMVITISEEDLIAGDQPLERVK